MLPVIDWEDLLLAYMHDPFDKALRVQGHESRARRYASAALGRDVSRKGLHRLAAQPDVQAAIAERVPAPTAGDGARAVGPKDGLRLTHPTSGATTELKLAGVDPEPDRAVALIEEIVHGLPGPRERFLAIWRLLPDRVAAEFGEDAARLPADTRIPDHTLFQHLDITAGLYAAGAPDGAAYLSFALGPVQPFIQAARSVRDLWSGSALLSWLAFQAMKPVLECLGPTAFVYPALRGAPLVDLWLRRSAGLGERVDRPTPEARMAPSLPHRFVAVVPWGAHGAEAEALRRACLDAAHAGWRRLAQAVRDQVDPHFRPLDQRWDRLWHRQIESAFDFRGAILPAGDLNDDRLARLFGEEDFASAWPHAQRIRDLAMAIPSAHRPSYEQDGAGRWQAQMELSARLMAATRAVRHVPETTGPGRGGSPAKCTLFGSWEQMGPFKFGESQEFWRRATKVSIGGVRLRRRERLCAVALAKRFAGPALLASEFEVTVENLRFPDTATVAAAEWLARAEIAPDQERRRHGDWSGLWLHWRERHQVPDEPEVPEDLWIRILRARKKLGSPPAYYAVVALDGDEVGRWLAGEKTPALRRLLHPKLCRYFAGLEDSRAERGLSARRPVGPALHGAISGALATFATEVAPQIVAKHHGTMIYSGGDDVLALCPVATALGCARDLRQAFSGRDDPIGDGWRDCGGRRRITMGKGASLSGGIAIVHYHEDLRLALETARAGEDRAKRAGRDRLDVTTARRSGETAKAICPWPSTRRLDELRREFVAGASDRWTYRLRAELPALGSDMLPPAALRAEIRRVVDHGDTADGGSICGATVAGVFENYCELRHGVPVAELLTDFVTLCQSASFMARRSDAHGI